MRRKKIKPAKGQTLFDPAWGAPSAEEARLPVYMSMTAPAVPMTLDVIHSDGATASYPVLAIRATLERSYARASSGDQTEAPRFPSHAAMVKAGWVTRELKERLDLVFYYPGYGLMTLAELRGAEPDAAVEVVVEEK
jgi:hypothetical protein